MAHMQFFQESLYLLRDLLAGYLSYELGSDLSKAIKNLRIPKERGYIDPNTTNLLE